MGLAPGMIDPTFTSLNFLSHGPSFLMVPFVAAAAVPIPTVPTASIAMRHRSTSACRVDLRAIEIPPRVHVRTSWSIPRW